MAVWENPELVFESLHEQYANVDERAAISGKLLGEHTERTVAMESKPNVAVVWQSHASRQEEWKQLLHAPIRNAIRRHDEPMAVQSKELRSVLGIPAR